MATDFDQSGHDVGFENESCGVEYNAADRTVVGGPTSKWLAQILSVVSVLTATAAPLYAEQSYTYSLNGAPGLIDMPTAQSAVDAELAATVSYFAGSTRNTLSFQVNPRLSGSLRYSRIANFNSMGGDTYDRSFDLRYRFLDEGTYLPSVAVGLSDVLGTGFYASEYLVATKNVTPRLAFTAGLGWGRLGSYNGIENPLGAIDDGFLTRPRSGAVNGGQLEFGRWFRGDMAAFGGVEWQATDQLTLKAEYSSDAYTVETDAIRNLFERNTPLNFGLTYRFDNGVLAQAQILHGSEIGVGLTYTFNPRTAAINGSGGSAPTPVVVRAPGAAADLGWTTQPAGPAILRDNVQTLLAAEGMSVEAFELQPREVILYVRNNRYIARAEAIGRAARILSATMPASVETFRIVPMVGGLATSQVTLQRSDLEALEYHPDNVELSYALADISDATPPGASALYPDGLYPDFSWDFGPHLGAGFFDPDSPLRADLSAELNFSYDIAPGLHLDGTVRQKLIGNIGGNDQQRPTTLPRVRSDGPAYASTGGPSINVLTLTYRDRIGENLYGRVTAGYLEDMYGGVSAEILWKPVASPFAVGIEANIVQQRDFDQLFGFRDYDVATGHISGYWNMGNGFHSQLDVGRYLAGDWGATVSVDRIFANGWRVGAYATKTNISVEEFGEGAFDKGLRLTIPLESILGTPSTATNSIVLQSLAQDGGARVNVSNRLYETIRSYHDPELQETWGRFWR
ncbi:YjbH domain-containing protein [Octadecabacter sp. G9-8]|uniref:YjbH domain-containing protein n=1 Tax=Octadecabacter dasysiphoniae TaxID=2909341 RepID=A0ABS9CS41_9RHOB|nr:YjbH domain-containing protein [Octadecabacter dasysiphoniae]MCF2869679.1 YjbH domain-containing protein [Octadecabacter dasysiphoniae]